MQQPLHHKTELYFKQMAAQNQHTAAQDRTLPQTDDCTQSTHSTRQKNSTSHRWQHKINTATSHQQRDTTTKHTSANLPHHAPAVRCSQSHLPALCKGGKKAVPSCWNADLPLWSRLHCWIGWLHTASCQTGWNCTVCVLERKPGRRW